MPKTGTFSCDYQIRKQLTKATPTTKATYSYTTCNRPALKQKCGEHTPERAKKHADLVYLQRLKRK